MQYFHSQKEHLADIRHLPFQNSALTNRMFHNFTFFEIKNAWGLIRSDFGHNEEIKKSFFLITRCFEGVPPPQSLIFLDEGNILLTSAISP